ncbi:hypothetical protein GDO81_029003 [Engystomops pustulosus]|nr:hypothetical protein GDO81_029003 [Engystomops pustulosus]
MSIIFSKTRQNKLLTFFLDYFQVRTTSSSPGVWMGCSALRPMWVRSALCVEGGMDRSVHGNTSEVGELGF